MVVELDEGEGSAFDEEAASVTLAVAEAESVDADALSLAEDASAVEAEATSVALSEEAIGMVMLTGAEGSCSPATAVELAEGGSSVLDASLFGEVAHGGYS